MLFLFSSRVDSVATSAVGNNEDLKLAVDTVVAHISQKLVLDTPGVDPNGTYYDYPDRAPIMIHGWPALSHMNSGRLSMETRKQIYIIRFAGIARHSRRHCSDIQPTHYSYADADGDGVTDSIWVQIPDKMSAKGKPIYAAIRIIDNGGMLNVNTGFKFDPATSVG